MEQETDDVRACGRCGNVVTVHKTLDGATYFIPVAENFLEAALKHADVDLFLHDRLRRAEKIIVDLRAQLRAKFDLA